MTTNDYRALAHERAGELYDEFGDADAFEERASFVQYLADCITHAVEEHGLSQDVPRHVIGSIFMAQFVPVVAHMLAHHDYDHSASDPDDLQEQAFHESRIALEVLDGEAEQNPETVGTFYLDLFKRAIEAWAIYADSLLRQLDQEAA